MSGMLSRLFRRGSEPDGAAAALEQMALDVPSPPPDPTPGQRRQAMLGEVILREALAEKILHGWLQNRHQTLYPLTLNFRTLSQAQRQLLVQLMAIGLHVGTTPGDPVAARAWLASVGADPDTLSALDASLAAAPPFAATLQAAIDSDIAAHAYVAILVCIDPRDEAGRRFLDYLGTRLALPSPVIRSANRRYRR